jgi:hypothetical protein
VSARSCLTLLLFLCASAILVIAGLAQFMADPMPGMSSQPNVWQESIFLLMSPICLRAAGLEADGEREDVFLV